MASPPRSTTCLPSGGVFDVLVIFVRHELFREKSHLPTRQGSWFHTSYFAIFVSVSKRNRVDRKKIAVSNVKYFDADRLF